MAARMVAEMANEVRQRREGDGPRQLCDGDSSPLVALRM